MSRTYAPAAGRRGPRPARPLLSLALLATLGTPGCGKGDKNYEITDVREKKVAGPMAPETTLAQRLGAEHGAGNGAEAAGDGAGGRMWAYTTPPGWTVLPPRPMRDVGWGVAGNADAECTFSTLPKGGGGLVANVNRWRKQMSLPPLDDAAVQALPKKTMFGRPATLVELSGKYVGMGGSNALEGAKFLGLDRRPADGVRVPEAQGPGGRGRRRDGALLRARRLDRHAQGRAIPLRTSRPRAPRPRAGPGRERSRSNGRRPRGG